MSQFKQLKWLPLLVIILTIFVQTLFTLRSTSQIRFEELSEAVRNVYWLKNHQIFDGISSNVGWYGTILVIYELFGFNLFTVKFLRLGLQLVSLICLTLILRQHLKLKHAWVLVLLYGLSPTLLYFNTLQTSFGLDLQLVPIISWLFFKTQNLINQRQGFGLMFVSWFLIMLSLMAYGTFLAYLPLFGLATLYLIFFNPNIKKNQKFGLLTAATAGFIIPLVLALLWMHQPNQLLYDPVSQSGLFRGGGLGDPILKPLDFWQHLKNSWQVVHLDLFFGPTSYYYEVLRPDFAHPLLRIAFWSLLILSIIMNLIIPLKKSKWLAIIGWLVMFLGLLVGGISNWLPGIRRSTPILLGFLVIIISLWQQLPKVLSSRNIFYRLLGGLTLITIGLLIIFRIRFIPHNLNGLMFASPNRADNCFHLAGKNPTESLQLMVDQLLVEKEEVTAILPNDILINCRLHELYPALKGACEWNNLNCAQPVFEKEFKRPN